MGQQYKTMEYICFSVNTGIGWLTSLPCTDLQISTYWSSAVNSPISLRTTSIQVVKWYYLEILILPSTSCLMQNWPPSWTFWTVVILSTKWTKLHIGYPTLSTLFMIKPGTTTISKVQAYRKYKEINPHAFMKDVQKFCLDKPPGPSLCDKINHYNTMLLTILDNHAPIKSHKCSNHPRFPGLMMTLLKPSDSEGTLRGSGIGIDPMWMLSNYSIASVNVCLTF